MKKMQKMRKIIALCLTVVFMCASVAGFSGCGKKNADDKGAILTIYLAGDPSNLNLDPGKMIYSSEEVKYLGLIFEGMMTMDENGKLQNGICKSYTITDDDANKIYKIDFNLKDTKWSDGIPVSADDFVYAWKRILDPAFASPAASLLYDVKNARAVKNGDMTVDDLGAVALDTTLLEVTFDHKIDYNKFLENLASISLVPLRRDTVDPAPDDWAKKPLTLLTDGPFKVTQMDYNKTTTLERSTYYLLKKDETNIFKYVKPYRIVLDFSRTLDQLTDAYTANNGDIFYLGNVPMAKYANFSGKAVLKDMLSAYSYHFNTSNPLFSKAEVRKALSIALDRNQIASIVGLGVKPATGIVPTGVIDATATADFREVGDKNGQLINPAGDVAAAKSLLQTAGVTSGSFELKYKDNEVEKAVADYAASVWQQLGFTVTETAMKGVQYGDDINSANYDVIGYDDQALGVDAFSVLAPFAKPFCGNVISFQSEGTSTVLPYITGFQNDSYDSMIEDIFSTGTDNNTRTQKLHDAEKALVDLAPIAPLYFNTNINITDKISGLSYSKFGNAIFTKANLPNYQQYITTETAAAPAADAASPTT